MMCPQKGTIKDREEATSRRTCLKLTGGVIGGGALLGSGSFVQRGAAATVVDLGDKGLSPGDTIDGYLERYFQSGNEVHVPAGTYQWNGTGLSGTFADASLVGDGEVVWEFARDYWNHTILAENGGDVVLKNITIRGQVDSGGNKARIRIDCRHPDSVVTLDNFNLPDGCREDGRAIGVYVGKQHEGTVNVRNVHIEGWNNNGLYAGPYGKSDGGGGSVHVEHSFFKNNNIDAVRLGGPNDSIEDTVIVQNDYQRSGNIFGVSGRGLRVRYGGDDITIRNVHITSSMGGPIVVPSRIDGSGSGTIEDVYIENNTGANAITVANGTWSADGVAVSGTGNRAVVGLDSTTGLCDDGTCEGPAKSLSELDERMGTGTGTDPAPDGHLLTVSGSTDVEKSYSFTVSGSVTQTTDNGASINPDDVVDGGSVDAKMFSGADSFRFDGEITGFVADDGISVTLDGAEVDPTDFGPVLTDTITIEGSTDSAERYEFTVSEAIERSTANGASINPDDTVEGTTATGQVFGSTDSYDFAGEITAFDYEGNPTVLVNGEAVDPDSLDPGPANTISIAGTDGTRARYEFVVDGSVEESTADGGSIDGGTVSGTVDGGTDSFGFDGTITYFKFRGTPTVRLNGEVVNPDDLAPPPTLDDTITVQGSGSGVSVYEFTVSDSVRKSTAGGASINGDDDVDWRTVAGRTRYGADSYDFAGEITDFSHDGDVTVLVNGSEVDPATLER